MFFGSRDPYRKLKKRIGHHKVLDQQDDLVTYAVDASYTAPPGNHDPNVVIMAETPEDVQEAVRFARTSGMKIVPRGAGTGMSAGSVPIGGGMVICTEKMKLIREVNTTGRWIQCEMGLTTAEVKDAVARHRFLYPPDPSSFKISSIGGNIAENAGGLRCVKYGTTKEYVLGLRYVNAFGELISTGVLAGDEANPLDLTPLLVGSEGLFGIIVEARLAVVPEPKATRTVIAHYPDPQQAIAAIQSILPELLPSVVEFMDDAVIDAIRQHDPYPFPEGTMASLIVETDGPTDNADAEMNRVLEILDQYGALELHTAANAAERERLWQLRRLVSPGLSRIASGKMNEDVVVPLGSQGELLRRVREISERTGIVIPVYGHAGDGNLHLNSMYDKDDMKQERIAHDAIVECFKAVVELGGTISGEHGIGAAKNRYMRIQYDAPELELFLRLKQAFDPDGLFNPYKLFPPDLTVLHEA
ncbi:FAD-binding protein [bacterium]|nr:FAD-binding protein [bacterium]